MPYEFLPHTADLKVRARGETVEAAFIESAMALKEAICGNIEIASRDRRSIRVEGHDLESLLYNFLEEIIYLLDAEAFMIAGVADVRLADGFLEAELTGSGAAGYDFANSVKAVTYSEMTVKQDGGTWVTEFVLDV